MKKKLNSLLVAILVAMLAISPVYAGGTSIKIGYGSVTATGTAWGFGKDAVISLDAEGIPVVTCGAPGNGSLALGQNPPKIQATDSQPAADGWLGKGKFLVNLEADITEEMIDSYPATYWGCSNNNWNANIAYVDWHHVTITIVNAKGDVVYQKDDFNCHTVLDEGVAVDVYCPAFQ